MNPNEPRVPAGNPGGGQWTAEANSIIQRAEQTLHGQRAVHNPTIDTRGMSDIGKHVLGQVGQHNVSPDVAASSILKEGYSKFTGHVASLARSGRVAESQAASAAQDLISDAHERLLGKEL